MGKISDGESFVTFVAEVLVPLAFEKTVDSNRYLHPLLVLRYLGISILRSGGAPRQFVAIRVVNSGSL